MDTMSVYSFSTVYGTEIVTAGGIYVLQAVSVYVSVLQTVLASITCVDVFQRVTSAWTPTTEATILMRMLVNNSMAERLAWKGCYDSERMMSQSQDSE
jgi:hypothetical protein